MITPDPLILHPKLNGQTSNLPPRFEAMDKFEWNDTVEETYYDKFRKSILDQEKDYPLPIPVISLIQDGESIAVMTRKAFNLWQGKQKSKKTTALAVAVAAFISSSRRMEAIQFMGSDDGIVLFFDTEQVESYAARTMRLVLKMADVQTSPRLIYCDLREFSPTDRKKVIEAGIANTPNVRLVVIDGLVDLTDASEGHMTVTDILKWCSLYDTHIAGVLHQNKANKNARAHIGSIPSQKCEMNNSDTW